MGFSSSAVVVGLYNRVLCEIRADHKECEYHSFSNFILSPIYSIIIRMFFEEAKINEIFLFYYQFVL